MARIDQIKSLLEEALAPVHQKLNVLVATNPQAAMQEKRVPVVESRNPAILAGAIVDEAVETWTYMKYETGTETLFLAVSCAHCGLCYNVKNDPADDVFLSVPLELIEMGILWAGLLPDYHQRGDGVYASTQDICIVCLDRVPDWVLSQAEMPVWPENPTDWEQTGGDLGCMIAGSSKTGEVHGRNLAPVVVGADRRYTMIFVKDSGEAGNSGTLMFQLGKDGTSKVIGVYLGTTTPNAPSAKDQKAKDVKVRGEICPLWKVNDFGKHSPSENEPDCYQIRTKSLFSYVYGGSTFKKMTPFTDGKAYYHNDELGYGIFVNKLSDWATAAEEV